MKEYLVRVSRIFDIYVEAEDEATAHYLASEIATESCADIIDCITINCEVVD